jgi:hypothetical protein
MNRTAIWTMAAAVATGEAAEDAAEETGDAIEDAADQEREP